MPSVRRVVALLVSCVMLALLLVESGFACAMPGMAAMDMAAMDMAAMDMAGGAMAGAGDASGMAGMAGMHMDKPAAPDRAPSEIPPSGTAPGEPPDDEPCRFPWAPAGCRDMAPCAPAALAAPAWTAPPGAGARLALAAGRVIAPPSVVAPPELPPPRG